MAGLKGSGGGVVAVKRQGGKALRGLGGRQADEGLAVGGGGETDPLKQSGKQVRGGVSRGFPDDKFYN